MNTNDEDLVDVLTQRVYNDLAFKQIENLLMKGKKLMNEEQMKDDIRCNINKYLSSQEQDQLLIQNQLDISNDEHRSKMMNYAVSMAVAYVHSAIEHVLMNEKFVRDNPFSSLEHPASFMIWKFWDEEMGVKLNIREVELDI
jgi:hypothetical protein